jgi:hypothetical protein
MLTKGVFLIMEYYEEPFEMQPFSISELIKNLQTIKDEHGDLQIAARTIDDETGLVQHGVSVGLWVFLKKEGSFLDRREEDLDDKFLSIG